MKRIAGALIVAAGVLQGCGGGGGGSSNTGGTPPPATSYALSAAVSGLEGSVTLVANAETPVTISSSTPTTLARLPAGTAYTVSISTQPNLQHCTLNTSSGTLSADATIDVTCASRITAQKGTLAGFEVARFNVAGLDLQNDEYSGSIDGSIGVTLAAVDDGLVLLMPSLTDGSHRLEVLVGDTRYPVDFSISTPALPAPAAQITTNFVTEIESALATLRADPEFSTLSDWAAIDTELASLKAQIATMSTTDLEALARIIAMNEPPTAAAAYAKTDRSPLLLKHDDATCRDVRGEIARNAIDSAMWLSWIVAAAAVGADLGPYGAVAGVSVSMGLYVFKAWPAMKATSASLRKYRANQCYWFQRLNFSLNLEERFTNQKPGRSAAMSMSMTQETLTFNHKRTREYDLTGSGTLPEDLVDSVPVATTILKYAAAFLSDELKGVLQDWTANYTRPIDLSDFTMSEVTHPSIEGTMNVQDGKLRLRFEYLPNQMPQTPVDFTFTLAGNNQSWDIPARLNLIEPPVAYADEVSTQTNEVLRGELSADFAESFRISLQPVNGSIALDATSGVYDYTPNTDFSGADMFEFVAANERGESQSATVSITVSGLCVLNDQGTHIERTCYTDMDRAVVDFSETLSSSPVGPTHVSRISEREVIPGDASSRIWRENYMFTIYPNEFVAKLHKADWDVLPGASELFAREYDIGEVFYENGAPTEIISSKTRRNAATMRYTSETISCREGVYHWTIHTGTFDGNGNQWADEYIRQDMNVPAPCPITADAALSILPLRLEDIRVWQIWNARN